MTGFSVEPSMLRSSTKYKPKLSFDERCAILALYHYGMKKDIIADVFSVDRRTVSHVTNTQSIHYRNVREERVDCGGDDFFTKYVTEDVHKKIIGYKERKDAEPVPTKVEEPPLEAGMPNQRMHQKKGLHSVTGAISGERRNIEVYWNNALEDNTGWFWHNLDEPDVEMRGPFGPFETSMKAFTDGKDSV